MVSRLPGRRTSKTRLVLEDFRKVPGAPRTRVWTKCLNSNCGLELRPHFYTGLKWGWKNPEKHPNHLPEDSTGSGARRRFAVGQPNAGFCDVGDIETYGRELSFYINKNHRISSFSMNESMLPRQSMRNLDQWSAGDDRVGDPSRRNSSPQAPKNGAWTGPFAEMIHTEYCIYIYILSGYLT